MDDTDAPARIPLPFAASAGGAYINPIPLASQIGITNGAASFTDGFPPDCFLPFASGGAGPFGKDFNGIFNQLSAGLQWAQAGGPWIYDGTFSTDIGGYPKGAMIATEGLDGSSWLSTVDDNTSDPETGGANWLLVRPQGFYLLDTGTANAGVVTLPAAITSLNQLIGVTLFIKKINAINSGAYNLTANTLTAPVVGAQGNPMLAGELGPNAIFAVIYNGTNFQTISPSAITQVSYGGTGVISVGAGAVLYGNGGATPLGAAVPGTATFPLCSQGALQPPIFRTLNLATAVDPNSKLLLTNGNAQLLLTNQLPGSYNFTVPANTFAILIELTAGGGGGAGGNGTNAGGGGGAGGTYRAWCTVAPGQVISYTVGNGGDAGTAGGDAPNNAGSTAFGSFGSATAGGGGASVANGAGGAPGIGIAGTSTGFIIQGGYGGDGAPAATVAPAGNGGSSYWGGGTRGSTTTPLSPQYGAPGSGGGGSYGGTTTGSRGAGGIVNVWG